MNFSKLMFLVVMLCFGTMQLRAQNGEGEVQQQLIKTEIREVTPVRIQNINLKKSIQLANRHRDLINALVKAKIKCNIDLFVIQKDVVHC
ncbi:hypothetical protein [Formosa haliotis]|uniref:hypothetical protein n=1 Tax=Formosa haliotis TaxID=1555194 RepID=UPI00082660B8|nr:hypothetical protein [Formosa haliotis]